MGKWELLLLFLKIDKYVGLCLVFSKISSPTDWNLHIFGHTWWQSLHAFISYDCYSGGFFIFVVVIIVVPYASLTRALTHTVVLPSLCQIRRHTLSYSHSLTAPHTHTHTHTHTISLTHAHTTSLRYWSALLKNIDTDIVSFDVYVNPKKCWTSVYKGGPDMLLDPDLQGKSVAVSFDFLSNLNFHLIIFVFMSFPLSKSILILIMILFWHGVIFRS